MKTHDRKNTTPSKRPRRNSPVVQQQSVKGFDLGNADIAQRKRNDLVSQSLQVAQLKSLEQLSNNYSQNVDLPIQRVSKTIQLGIKKRRKNPQRAAKRIYRPPRRYPVRSTRKEWIPNKKAAAYWVRKRKNKIALAQKMGAYRTKLRRNIATYAGYPEGSYGHGRWLYLMGRLNDLGKTKGGLIDFSKAPIEVDHSPHDASQRTGLRVDDDISRHRVAVPLPRGWHRRHKTTHGPGARRHDNAFANAQTRLVREGNYAQALQNHLLDTFHDDAIGRTGHKKISIVARHTKVAVDYAHSNIPVSIFPGHAANTSTISDQEHLDILQALRNRIEEIKQQPGRGAVVNPF